jgi:hypothetical protein
VKSSGNDAKRSGAELTERPMGVGAGLEPADDLASRGERPVLNHGYAAIGIGIGDPAFDHRLHRLGRIAAGIASAVFGRYACLPSRSR